MKGDEICKRDHFIYNKTCKVNKLLQSEQADN